MGIGRTISKGEERAKLAVEVFVYQVKIYWSFRCSFEWSGQPGFTGGIGENDSFIREKVNNLDYLGIKIDREKNQEIKERRKNKFFYLSS